MNALFLLRHGEATPAGIAGQADHDRILTPAGEAEIVRIARGLRRLDLEIEGIVTSPLPRAQRTAELVAEVLRPPGGLELDDALATGHSAESVRQWLLGRSEGRLMVVGHNPTLSDLVGLLVTGQPRLTPCELRKGGVAALVGQPSGRMELDWLARPKLLRRLGGD